MSDLSVICVPPDSESIHSLSLQHHPYRRLFHPHSHRHLQVQIGLIHRSVLVVPLHKRLPSDMSRCTNNRLSDCDLRQTAAADFHSLLILSYHESCSIYVYVLCIYVFYVHVYTCMYMCICMCIAEVTQTEKRTGRKQMPENANQTPAFFLAALFTATLIIEWLLISQSSTNPSPSRKSNVSFRLVRSSKLAHRLVMRHVCRLQPQTCYRPDILRMSAGHRFFWKNISCDRLIFLICPIVTCLDFDS